MIRVSGPRAEAVARHLLDRSPAPPRYATFCRFVVRDESGCESAVDEVVATLFRAPASYTGEDVVEISSHGSPAVLEELVRAGVRAGARLAEPGEFTLRAFLRGRIDLVQAEAVADLVDAVTPLQARAAFDQLQGTLTRAITSLEADLFRVIAALEASIDFPGEGCDFPGAGELRRTLEEISARIDRLVADGERGRLIREGRQVVVAGSPNVGKSSLFNCLVGAERAIVAVMPGTTRDLVTETVDLAGMRLTVVDTAGLRQTSDEVEEEGVRRARNAVEVADAAIVVLDLSRPLSSEDMAVLALTRRLPRVVVANKSDLEARWEARAMAGDTGGAEAVVASTKTGEGLEAVRTALAACLGGGERETDLPAVTNVRHLALLGRAREALGRSLEGMTPPGGEVCSDADAGDREAWSPLPEEFLASDLREALEALQEVTGRRAAEDLLGQIFSRFCVGK